ncbi:MAG: hypothetical protein IKL79_05445 [Clostridia bacterium]|nr:hypothetical protein [Clostridia bacterium]
MKKTKLLILLLVFALALPSFVACRQDNGDTNTPVTCDEHIDLNEDGNCDFCQNPMPAVCETHKDTTLDGTCDVCGGTYETITVADALELCGEAGNITEERYYVRATVKTVSNVAYGEMYVEDESGEIYVYGTYDFDGVKSFSDLENQPKRGDTVVLACILQNYNGTKEVKNARLVGFVHNEADISDYTEMTVSSARAAEKDELVIIEGVVSAITYATGKVPVGAIITDATGSIYVYGADVAGAVTKGNKVKVAGVKDYWILDSEKTNAQKYGYEGCNQLSDATLLENDKGNHEFDKTSVEETTVKAIMDTPVTENVTSQLFKVTALIKKVIPESGGFVNYYIFDIDGTTGTYTYTQCNGSDFAWLDEFDGKICTVYLTALNAKSTASGCNWRFLPVSVSDDSYTIAKNDIPAYALTYHALGQFAASYTSDPELVLINTVSSALLGFEGVSVSYTSDNEGVVKFTAVDNGIAMTLVDYGTATVTVTATYDGVEKSEEITLEYKEPQSFDYITVQDVINSANDTVVTVKGIVGPSLVNQTGFYLFDGSTFIAVTTTTDVMSTVELGQEVILTGTKVRRVKTDDAGNPYECHGQTHIKDAVILANNYGSHTYSTESFVTDVTIEQFYSLDKTVDYSTTAFILEAKVFISGNNVKLQSLDGSINVNLYSSGAGQYSFLQQYNGQVITVEIAACNWNSKGFWACCVLAVVHEDGTKTYNTLNFDSN